MAESTDIFRPIRQLGWAQAWSGVTERLAEPIAAGLVERSAEGRMALTLRGRLLSNEVFGRLFDPALTLRAPRDTMPAQR